MDQFVCGNSSNSRKIFTLQNKIVRILAGAQPRTPCSSLFKQLQTLHVPCHYILSLISFIVFSQEIFQTNSSIRNVNRRNKGRLHWTNFNLSYFQKKYILCWQYMYVCMYARTYVCMYAYICRYIYPYVCMYVIIYGGMYVYIYMYLSLYTYVCIYYIHIYVRMYICRYICMYVCMHICITYICIYVLIFIYVYM
jgi:hypothetical protein